MRFKLKRKNKYQKICNLNNMKIKMIIPWKNNKRLNKVNLYQNKKFKIK